MGLAPWGALGSGAFKSAEQRKAQEGRQIQASDEEIRVSEVLERIAKRRSSEITSIALAYVMHKTPYVFPIVGGRKVDHLKGNIEALKLHLSKEDIEEIEIAVPFDLGFPSAFLYQTPKHVNDVWLLNMGGNFDYVPLQEAISSPEK